jgi:hypothetical protein
MKNPKHPGRRPKDIDPIRVMTYARAGCTVQEIAEAMHCSKDTLERRFRDVIRIGRAEGKCSIRLCQMAAAERGDPTMLKHLGKHWLGQNDSVDVTSGGEPIGGQLSAAEAVALARKMIEDPNAFEAINSRIRGHSHQPGGNGASPN